MKFPDLGRKIPDREKLLFHRSQTGGPGMNGFGEMGSKRGSEYVISLNSSMPWMFIHSLSKLVYLSLRVRVFTSSVGPGQTLTFKVLGYFIHRAEQFTSLWATAPVFLSAACLLLSRIARLQPGFQESICRPLSLSVLSQSFQSRTPAWIVGDMLAVWSRVSKK